MTVAEANKLTSLATGKRVLELGSHFGFSTVVLSQVAAEVHAVDWHLGDAQAGQGDTLPVYWQNLLQCGRPELVVTHVGRFEEVLPLFKAAAFDLIFIDGAHDGKSVERDVTLALRLVRLGGVLAFHDYGRFEVAPAVDMVAQVYGNVELVDTLAVIRVGKAAEYMRTDLAFFRNRGDEIRGVIHVGANDGKEIPWYRAEGYGPIIAVEPHPEAFKKLVACHGREALCVRMAFGARFYKELLRLNVPADGDTEKTSKYNAIPTPGHEWTNVPQGVGVYALEIRLDDWASNSGLDLSQYNALVIDVQGMELEVLRGAQKSLRGFDFLSVECSAKPMYDGEAPAEEVILFLKEQGFRQDTPVCEHDDILFSRCAWPAEESAGL